MQRYSREDALPEREYVLLLESTRRLPYPKSLQARFVIMAAGRMGMRSGEIAHIDRSWVNFAENTITIPEFQKCNSGKNEGEICGYCRNRVRDYLNTHNTTIEKEVERLLDEFGEHIDKDTRFEMAKQRVEERNQTIEDVSSEWWQPKTPAAARTIPFDFDIRLHLCIERFFEQYSSFPISKASLNRRVTEASEESELDKRVYPHSLRATAATIHASRNVSPYALMSVMGWRDLDTARKYIAASDDSAAIEIRSKYR